MQTKRTLARTRGQNASVGEVQRVTRTDNLPTSLPNLPSKPPFQTSLPPFQPSLPNVEFKPHWPVLGVHAHLQFPHFAVSFTPLCDLRHRRPNFAILSSTILCTGRHSSNYAAASRSSLQDSEDKPTSVCRNILGQTSESDIFRTCITCNVEELRPSCVCAQRREKIPMVHPCLLRN